MFSLYQVERDGLLTSAFLTRSRLECHHIMYTSAPLSEVGVLGRSFDNLIKAIDPYMP